MSTKTKAAPKAETKVETPKQEKTAPYAVGAVVAFKGYSQLESGQQEIFRKGDLLRIVKVEDSETFQCVKYDNEKITDTAFDTELEAAPELTAEETKAPKLKKGKAPVEGEIPEKAAGKVGRPKKEEEPEEVLEILPIEDYDAETQKVLKTDASALKAAKSLTHKIAETFWTLGGVLSFIRRHKSYGTIMVGDELPYEGKRGFANYCELELDLHYRKAMYYIDIYEKFAPTGIDPERIIALGWGKAGQVATVVTNKNAEKWLTKAEKLNREDLQAEITTARVKSGDGGEVNPNEQTVEQTKFVFKLFADQGTVVKEALAKARETLGTEDNNAAFSHIVMEWLTMQGGSTAVSVDDAFKALENTYSLKSVSDYAKSHYSHAKK